MSASRLQGVIQFNIAFSIAVKLIFLVLAVFGYTSLWLAVAADMGAFGVLYGTSTLLPALLESLFGYDAFHAGLVLSPSGAFTILALIVVGALLGRGIDARWLIAIGLLILAAGCFWMSQMTWIFPRGRWSGRGWS
jgi:hypothetical protein